MKVLREIIIIELMDKIVSFMILYENHNSIPTVQTTKACTKVHNIILLNTHTHKNDKNTPRNLCKRLLLVPYEFCVI